MDWINIDDRPPELNQRVLILIAGEIEIATYEDPGRLGSRWNDGWGPVNDSWAITHWASLENIPLPYPEDGK